MQDPWSLTIAALHGEPWRLWTGHIAHWDARHFVLDALAAVPPLMMLRKRVLLWCIAAAPLISLVILAVHPNVAYRGMSALVVGLWALTGNRAMLALVLAKLIVESIVPLHFVGVPPMPLAHWAGFWIAVASRIVGWHAPPAASWRSSAPSPRR